MSPDSSLSRLRPFSPISLLICLLWAVMPLLALVCGGCVESEQRADSLLAIARWEDRRLASPESLSAMIQADDAHVRKAAVRATGLIGRDDVLPDLLAALTDRSNAVRAEAAFALGLLGSPRAVAPLIEAAASPNRQLRLASLEGLAHLPHDGEVFVEPALHGDVDSAIRAWNGLRNRAADMPPAQLATVIRSGLIRYENEIVWRVLRCAELVPEDSTLVPLLAPFARSREAQVRVHACRALARQTCLAAVEAVLASHEDKHDFSRHDVVRVRVAQYRALGRLLPGVLGDSLLATDDILSDRITSPLRSGAQHLDPHVSRTALEAMADAVGELPAPVAAAERESLLPVWRIRCIRVAEGQLANPSAAVRTAATRAFGELRGRRAETVLVSQLDDPSPAVRVAALTALARQAENPWSLLSHYAGQAGSERDAGTDQVSRPAGAEGVATDVLLITAALEAAVDRFENRREFFPEDESIAKQIRDDFLVETLLAALNDPHFVIAATAAPLLGRFPSGGVLTSLDQAFRQAYGEGVADLRLGVLEGLDTFFTALADSSAAAERDRHRTRAGDLLESAFDASDLRQRLRAREIATAHDILPPELIPSEASLRATLPAFSRSRGQPPLALPGPATRVRCSTDHGEFVMELDAEHAPNTVAVFLALIRDKFYTDGSFHRVVPDFVIQGGDPTGTGWGGPGYSIRSEWSRLQYERGTVGIAHSGKDSGGSQFFVCHSPQPHLNGRYTIFGKVVHGMEVVDRIQPGDRFQLTLEPN
ncbi:MAG: peptidylprolyl isomerase [bacterium]